MIFQKAWEALKQNPLPLLLPFMLVHAAEALPEIAWYQLRVWIGGRADEHKLQETIFGLFANAGTRAALIGAAALVLVLLCVAYAVAFASVIAFLRKAPPDYKGALSSLTWFGLVLLLPYALAGMGIALIAYPLLGGQGWSMQLAMPMFASFAAALALSLVVQPYFFMGVAAAVEQGLYGMPAMSAVAQRISKRVGSFLAMAAGLVLVGFGLMLLHRVFNAVLPEGKSLGFGDIVGKMDAENLYKALFMPSDRPLWADVVAGVGDIAFESVRDAYFMLVSVFWYSRKE